MAITVMLLIYYNLVTSFIICNKTSFEFACHYIDHIVMRFINFNVYLVTVSSVTLFMIVYDRCTFVLQVATATPVVITDHVTRHPVATTTVIITISLATARVTATERTRDTELTITAPTTDRTGPVTDRATRIPVSSDFSRFQSTRCGTTGPVINTRGYLGYPF